MTLKEQIEQILAAHDPEILIEYGAPSDEYSPEANKIAALVGPSNSLDEICVIVAQVFHSSFDTFYKFTRDESTTEIKPKFSRVEEPPPEREQTVQRISKDIYELLQAGAQKLIQ